MITMTASFTMVLSCIAQTTLAPGDLVVATTAGVYWLPQGTGTTATLVAPAAAFSGLTAPAVEWERFTDGVLLVSQSHLFRVVLAGNPPSSASITDLTPAIAGVAPILADLDVDPATGDLYVLDRGNGAIHRFTPPFAQGMAPVQSVAVPVGARSIAVDSRIFPLGVVFTDDSAVKRIRIATLEVETLANLPFGDGADCEPALANGAMISKSSTHQVVITVGSPSVVVDVDFAGFCAHVARRPRDCEWDPLARRLYVLAEDGIAACFGSYAGGNHVVRFQVPGGGPNPPVVLTDPMGSGIDGTNGDLTIVQGDFAFGAPYGTTCPSLAFGPGVAPFLDHVDGIGMAPIPGSASFALVVSAAPSFAPLFLVAGASKAAIPMQGCVLFAMPALIAALPPADANGALTLPAPIPSLPALQGIDVFLAAIAVEPSGHPLGSNGLQLHLGS